MIQVLHLGFAFPPGYQKLHPGINPAGHLVELRLIEALRQHVEVSTVGMLPVPIPKPLSSGVPADGLAHDLILREYAPHLWRRWRSYRQLVKYYKQREAAGRQPDIVLFYNISRVYSQFARWLAGRQKRPRLVLLLCDAQLGYPQPKPFTRWRHSLKPFHVDESQFIQFFDACIGMSPEVQRYFPGRPFLWMPGACDPRGAEIAKTCQPSASGPLIFGFFGSLGSHAGAFPLAEVFSKTPLDARLRVCGYGKQAEAFQQLARQDPRIEFVGRLSYDDCLRFGATCDVLINPRTADHGNKNNFPSKLFEYAMCARPIISSQQCGSEVVLGSDGFLFSPENFEEGLRQALLSSSRLSRADLNARGARIKDSVINRFTWPIQTEQIARFLTSLVKKSPSLS